MTDINKPVIAFAGGGTAGHVNPLLSTVAALRDSGYEFDCFVLGTACGLERELVPAAGLELVTVDRLPLPRRPSMDLVRLPFRLRRAVKSLVEMFSESSVSLLAGFGGYVSTPAYLAARSLGIPVVIHEQNARPGLANRLGACWAEAVALTFPGTELKARRGVTEVTGLPLRPAITDLARQLKSGVSGGVARQNAAQYFGLDPNLPTLLVTGGSLGAQYLNETLPDVVLRLPVSTQVVHLTGKGKDGGVRGFVRIHDLESRYKVFDYLSEMHHGLALADVVVCRAGAATVAENCALGIPAFYVPLPHGNGEQAFNASSVVEARGAFLVKQSEVTVEKFADTLVSMLSPDCNSAMRVAAQEAGTTQGASNLAKLIVTILENSFRAADTGKR